MYSIPNPEDPADIYVTKMDSSGVTLTLRDQVPYMDAEVFKQEISEHVRRKRTLNTNIQKSYSLVLGQCMELMKRCNNTNMGGYLHGGEGYD